MVNTQGGILSAVGNHEERNKANKRVSLGPLTRELLTFSHG